MFEIVPQEVLWSIWGSHQTLWSLPLQNVTWHSGTWPYTMTTSIDQTLHQFANLLPNWTLIPILTLIPNFGGFHRTLQRVRLATRGRLLLRTPGPVPFGTCICSTCCDHRNPISILPVCDIITGRNITEPDISRNVGFHRTLQRVRLANRGRLLLRTPGPVPFGTCICSHVETILSWTCHVYGPLEFRLSLGTSILLDFLRNCMRFSLIACNGCGMPTEDAYSPGHLVLSYYGNSMCSNVETDLSGLCLVFGLVWWYSLQLTIPIGSLSMCNCDFRKSICVTVCALLFW